jgi:HlyD family secretion protein
MFINRKLWWILGLVIVFAGAGYVVYDNYLAEPEVAQEEDQVQTTSVRRGDMVVSASGIGTVIPVGEINLSFSTSGILDELNVQVGDLVKSGDVLAKQGNIEQMEAAVVSDRLSLLTAQQELEQLYDGAPMAMAEAQKRLVDAQLDLDELLEDRELMNFARCKESTINSAYADYIIAQDSAENLQKDFDINYAWRLEDDLSRANALTRLTVALEAFYAAQVNLEYCSGSADESEILSADANVLIAEAELKEAERQWEKLKENGLDAIDIALAEEKVNNAELQLTLSTQDLEYAVMVAPFDGTVMEINAAQGENVGTSTIISLANLEKSMLEIFVDETDMDFLAVGYKVDVIFDAMPDDIFTAVVTRVDPELVTSSNVQYVRGLAEILQGEQGVDLPRMLSVGMNAVVDIISAEAEDALLVPLEALRELGDDEYAVFVLDGDELKMRIVEVGLRDYAYAEILSGLEEGEFVSTGIVETN